tara:strand:+ start:10234 stop:11160 length:927 start_codon:yes stop_codon:yes gene_type:complete
MAKRHLNLDEIHSDLKKILYLEASRIAALRWDEKASEFLGVLDEIDPDKLLGSEIEPKVLALVDLSKFHIAEALDLAYSAQFEKPDEWLLTAVESETLQAFLSTMPSSDLSGTAPIWLTEEGACIRMARAGVALGKIQAMLYGNVGIQGGVFDVFHLFSVRDMAALANMSEGSIRNALVSKKGDRLDKMEMPGGQVLIDPVEACRWLSERRGYRAHGGSIRGKDYFPEYVRYDPNKALRWLSLSTYWHSGSVERTAAKLGWSKDQVVDLLGGNFPLDEAEVRKFATVTFIDPDDLVKGAKILHHDFGG